MDQGDSLEALLADAVAAEAARERAADRLLRQAAAEEATFAGVLVDLAERAEPVAVRTASGRVHRGAVRAVGRDFAVVQHPTPGGAPAVFVPLRAITSVRPNGPDRWDVAGARRAPIDASLAAVLGGLAQERPRVQVGVDGDGGTFLVGELASAGADVLHLRPPGIVVPLASVTELVVLEPPELNAVRPRC